MSKRRRDKTVVIGKPGRGKSEFHPLPASVRREAEEVVYRLDSKGDFSAETYLAMVESSRGASLPRDAIGPPTEHSGQVDLALRKPKKPRAPKPAPVIDAPTPPAGGFSSCEACGGLDSLRRCRGCSADCCDSCMSQGEEKPGKLCVSCVENGPPLSLEGDV